MSRSALYLRIPGEPRGQARARHGKGFTYKDGPQEAYEETIASVWLKEGEPRLTPGPYRVEVRAWMKRPDTHFLKSGDLNTEGLRKPYPCKRPDADNFLKQVDALVKLGALPDDAAMVEAVVRKSWAIPEVFPGPSLEIYAVSLNGASA